MRSGFLLQSGFGIYNLNRPDVALSATSSSLNSIDLPFLLHHFGSLRLPISESLYLEPGYLLSFYGQQSYTIVGLASNYQLPGDRLPSVGLEAQLKYFDDRAAIDHYYNTAWILSLEWKRLSISCATEFFAEDFFDGNGHEVLLGVRF